jgi:maltose O-acetyltransferase
MAETTERERMLAGEPYRAWDEELVRERARARRVAAQVNATTQDELAERRALLEELLARYDADAWIEPPFHCDYGWNLSLGERSFMNFGCVALDCAPIAIGALTKLGPYVQLCAATHPVNPRERESGLEYALPISIGNNVWIGSGAIIGPGITIGDDSVIGAGSVVLADVPAGVVAAGSPARVVREL